MPISHLPVEVSSSYPPAFPSGNASLHLWAESPAEAANFYKKAIQAGYPLPINKVFVAKRTPNRGPNKYIQGLYFRTSGYPDFDVYQGYVQAPKAVIDLVNWCTCDIMVTRGETPVFVLEDTTHIVRMNLYQRIPRLARAAMLGVPSLMLQGTRGLNFRLRGDQWALYRYYQAFEAIARIYSKAPSLPVIYMPSINGDEDRANQLAFSCVKAWIEHDVVQADIHKADILNAVQDVLTKGVNGAAPPDINSIYHTGPEVIVRIGAKPDKKSWNSKGSGQMDPYIGMIAAAKYIYCYDANGQQSKPLIVEFTYLPLGFKFFSNPSPTALYKRLPFELADEVRFLG
jgi:hypothetical protein